MKMQLLFGSLSDQASQRDVTEESNPGEKKHRSFHLPSKRAMHRFFVVAGDALERFDVFGEGFHGASGLAWSKSVMRSKALLKLISGSQLLCDAGQPTHLTL